ncbi:N-acetylmuramic acid 6-phosphate etherase [Bacillaceae bacterium SIJ1]|uniref:N-acetylmuramic acid 6-phosphate etherase n=1 Tax=Litoribacterium kuwaitense TaxID=1398745 RepID=UPI0013E9EB6A|nr:N-acetylmuramic acid 6-phosphate etherase [Litoribacterium kuwaitense]NGP46372.1 N-acetylmuramic acid 6-phosphate etherase [Litoribacterium kuwaitense]
MRQLQTERRNEASTNLDAMNVLDILSLMNEEDEKVALHVKQSLPQIAKLIQLAVPKLRHDGRLIYIGAGTSGRLGVLDAVECPPTFGVSSSKVVGLIAGGEGAFSQAEEGAEDSRSMGAQDLSKIQLNEQDVVVGIAASGRTPYVLGALEHANKVGALTASLSCNCNAVMSEMADVAIEVPTGSEVLSGSTRLKAGSAQKMVLNMISTATMVGLGKVYQNLMVDMKVTNEKLEMRGKNIIVEATGVSFSVAEEFFNKAGGHVKTAIVMILADLPVDEAKLRLHEAQGVVRQAVSAKE